MEPKHSTPQQVTMYEPLIEGELSSFLDLDNSEINHDIAAVQEVSEHDHAVTNQQRDSGSLSCGHTGCGFSTNHKFSLRRHLAAQHASEPA